MDKSSFDAKISEISKSVMSYCVARTSNRYDAEDLAQDIITELVKSVGNVRDDKAFYGFMWSVAKNVYAMWCRKRAKYGTTELTDDIIDDTDHFDLTENGDLYLLRRELSLLSKKHRQAVVLYYMENKSCQEISADLGISESMVKYLLFKARKILKEGMDMERNYGEQSYNPKNLALMYMGEGPNKFWSITEGKKIPQNILWACYNDELTQEEISLQIGVALPYLEPELDTLEKAGLLVSKSGRYKTNIIIFTKDFKSELAAKIEKTQEAIADAIHEFIADNEEKIRGIGFHMNDMSKNSFDWHVSCAVLWMLFGKIGEDVPYADYPVTAFGERAFVWGDESPSGVLNCCNMSVSDGWLESGELWFLDYLPKPKSDNNYFYRNRKLANFFIRLAAKKVGIQSDYEKEFIADLIKDGYATSENGSVSVTVPVYTREQVVKLHEIARPTVEKLYASAETIKQNAGAILKNHVPSHLKKQSAGIINKRMFDDVVGAAAEMMCRKDYLKASWSANETPTVYAVID